MDTQLAAHDASINPEVYIYSGVVIKRTAKILLVSLVLFLLLIPVLLCSVIRNIPARVAIIFVSMLVYLTTLSILVTRRTTDLIISGAT